MMDAPIPPAAPPTLEWLEGGSAHSARWRSERAAPPPKRVVLADDTTTADAAYRLACEGTALLWRGDFQNARQMLQALARRIDKTPARKQRKGALAHAQSTETAPQDAFNQHRQAQAQRARVLGMVLVPFDATFAIPLRRAPDVRQACLEAWRASSLTETMADAASEPPLNGKAAMATATTAIVASLRDLLGMVSAHEWRKKGVEIAALGAPPDNRIHPHYGVFSPVRGEYLALVAKAPLPACMRGADGTLLNEATAFDIGTGTGVLSVVLARRGIAHITATDLDPRALACAQDNIDRLGAAPQVQLVQANLFPPGRAALVVCNPPWLPARPSSPIEYAVYDEGSRMLLGYLAGLKDHLQPGGEGWLILSDLAEHLGLRSREMLQAAFADNGLQVLGRLDAKPQHPKAQDATDALHTARTKEVTSLWRLGALV